MVSLGRIRGLLFCFAALALHSCVSPLSEISLSDPSAIAVQITIRREESVEGTVTREAYAVVKDRNSQWVHLRDGGMTVNGEKMQVAYWPVVNLPYYVVTAGRPSFVPNSLYVFRIELSDSQEYTCSICTPRNDLGTFDVPASHPRCDTLYVTWQCGEVGCSMCLDVKKRILRDTVLESSYDTFVIGDPSCCRFAFPPSYFESGLQSMDIRLEMEKYGTVDSRLRTESYLEYAVSIERRVGFSDCAPVCPVCP